MKLNDVLQAWQGQIPQTVMRVPAMDDASRWLNHGIGGVAYRVAQPITFTPYASARPCSARCQFCSENLRDQPRTASEPASGHQSGPHSSVHSSSHSSLLRPQQAYFTQLACALTQLRGLPLSYSLSGLEMTDDIAWLCQLMAVLAEHAAHSPVEQRVLYTNGSGFADPHGGAALAAQLAQFQLNLLELSRHHFDAAINQKIMRFRPANGVMDGDNFAAMVKKLLPIFPLKLVCIVQKGGVDSLAGLLAYVAWARQLGVEKIVFRELSLLDDNYLANKTFLYIAAARVSVAGLLLEFLQHASTHPQFEFRQATHGYYFSNLVACYQGVEITFESSNYGQMHSMHDSGRIYKLVFHANGNLCADWHPDRHILFSAGGS